MLPARHVICWLLALTCCVPTLELPSDAQVTCETNADCPTGTECRTHIKRCIDTDEVDQTAPDLESVVLNRTTARVDDVFDLTITPNEMLAENPVVAIDLGGSSRRWDLVEQTGSGLDTACGLLSQRGI